MIKELIKFPQVGGAWQDSGEGGMYIYAVILRPADHQDNCTVENGIVLTPPDYPVSDIRPFWGSPEDTFREHRIRDEAARLMEQQGRVSAGITVRGLLSRDSLSAEMLAAVFMGSTRTSLMAADGSEAYWQAGWGDLTPKGGQVVHHLRDAFGITPALLTFLDT